MINWIAGNWPDRFKCLVNHDGVFDMRPMYYGTEELWFPEWEQGGPYWMNPEQHEKHNPALFVSKWKTPMLVIQGQLDYRIPVEQGLSAFTALQRREIPSKSFTFRTKTTGSSNPETVSSGTKPSLDGWTSGSNKLTIDDFRLTILA